MSNIRKISSEEFAQQKEYISKIKSITKDKSACVITYGCQQNENDSEKLKGMLSQMGYKLIDDREKADAPVGKF